MKNKKEFIESIDKAIIDIYQFVETNNSNSHINRLFLLVLSQTKFELICNSEISDATAAALIQLCVFQNQELFYSKGKQLYTELSLILSYSDDYNKMLHDNEITALGATDKSWMEYFEKTLLK